MAMSEDGGSPKLVPIATQRIPVVEEGYPVRLQLRFIPHRDGTNPFSDGAAKARINISDHSGLSSAEIEVPIKVPMPQLVLDRALLAPSNNETPATLIAFLSNTGSAPSVPVSGQLKIEIAGRQSTVSDEVSPGVIQPGSGVEIALTLNNDLVAAFAHAPAPVKAILELREQPATDGLFADVRWNLSADLSIETVALWPQFVAFGAAILFATSLLFAGLQRHPVVVRLTNEPQQLLTLAPDGLARANFLMRLTLRRQGILFGADVTEKRLRLGMRYAAAPASRRIQIFADRLGLQVKRAASEDPKLLVWIAETPEAFLINLPRFKIIIPDDDLEAEESLPGPLVSKRRRRYGSRFGHRYEQTAQCP